MFRRIARELMKKCGVLSLSRRQWCVSSALLRQDVGLRKRPAEHARRPAREQVVRAVSGWLVMPPAPAIFDSAPVGAMRSPAGSPATRALMMAGSKTAAAVRMSVRPYAAVTSPAMTRMPVSIGKVAHRKEDRRCEQGINAPRATDIRVTWCGVFGIRADMPPLPVWV